MDVPRLQTCLALFVALFAVVACGESSPTAPASAQAAQAEAIRAQDTPEKATDLEAMSDRELLIAVMGKLNALEARMENETEAVYARIDSLVSTAGSYPILAAAAIAEPADKLKDGLKKATEGYYVIECRRIGKQVSHKVQYKARAEAGGQAEVGPDAVEAEANAQAEVELEIATEGEPRTVGKAYKEVCKSEPVTAQVAAIVDMMESASGLGLNLANLERFTQSFLTDTQIGFDRIESILSTLPIPIDQLALLRDPLSLAQQSREVFDFAMDNRCNPNLYAGTRLADVMSEVCALEDQLPTIQEAADILTGLGDLDLSALGDLKDDCGGKALKDCINALDNQLARVCNTSKFLRDKLETGLFHSKNNFSLFSLGGATGHTLRITGAAHNLQGCPQIVT